MLAHLSALTLIGFWISIKKMQKLRREIDIVSVTRWRHVPCKFSVDQVEIACSSSSSMVDRLSMCSAVIG